MASASFRVNDPVTVTLAGGDDTLEGVVLWSGTKDDGDPYYGVRLTGKSIGKGTSDGEDKFACGPNGALFVKAPQLSLRTLTKLEELRLKRELRSTSAAVPSSRENTPPRDTSTRAPSVATTTTTATRSKLEEIRMKRAALQKEREATTTTPVREAPTEAVASPPSAEKISTAALQQMDALRAQVQSVTARNQELELSLQQLQTSLTTEQTTWNQETVALKAENTRLTTALQQAKTLAEKMEKATTTPTNAAAPTTQQYKERASLQAQLAAAQNKLEVLQLDRLELQNTLEESTVDLEFLQARHEELQDKYEEALLDGQAHQLALEEAQLELEEAQQNEGFSASTSHDDENDDRAVWISQNTRLRTAVTKLREQAGMVQVEHQRELRTVQQQAAQAATEERQKFAQEKAQMMEQVQDLKEMVEQGAAYESMVEDLSDRVLMNEEETQGLRTVIRELEEAAELTAEMEEVAAEELRALNLDLQGRDSMVQNLEEAIRMQRRREEDFKRTVANYKSSVETLKQEKQALMGMFDTQTVQENSSQKALAKAAQWVADAARTRRGQAQAVVDAVSALHFRHVAVRVEALLPPAAALAEINAVKGELATATTLGKVARVLDGVEQIFTKGIRPQVQDVVPIVANSGPVAVNVNDEKIQQINTFFHQADFCNLLLDASSDWMRCLLAGQWPDIMTPENSADLGSALGHAVVELDLAVSHVLRMLKEEGELSVDQSNIGDLQLAVSTSLQNLRGEMERKEGPLVPAEWNPTCLNVFRAASRAKLNGLASASAFSLATEENDETCGALYNKLEQCSSQAANACERLSQLDIQNENLVEELSVMFQDLATETDSLRVSIKSIVTGSLVLDDCVKAADAVLRRLMKILPVLRSEKLVVDGNKERHPLSPESLDPWTGVLKLTRGVRGVDGDPDDVNALLRGRSVEDRLSGALDKEPQLELALTKVSSLEKTLSSRSKEISMQNARMVELEKLAAKTHASPMARGANKNIDLISSDEYKSVKEENKVLTEAMDVMQRDIEMYETEIRQLKDFKSPGGKRARTPQRGASINIPQENTSALEATLFRPALQQALAETSRWKASKMADILDNLPPLPKPVELPADPLLAAQNAFRLHLTSAKLVDLTAPVEPRQQLRMMSLKHAAAIDRFQASLMQVQ